MEARRKTSDVWKRKNRNNVTDPAFQPYIAQAWASFQADKSSMDGHSTKKVRFDGVVVLAHPTIHSNLQVASVLEELEILSPKVHQAQQPGLSSVAAPITMTPPSSLWKTVPSTSADISRSKTIGNTSSPTSNANQPSSYSLTNQYM